MDPGEQEPPPDTPDDPWLDPQWFDEPRLDRTWTEEPSPPAWAPPATIPRAIFERRQALLDELGRAITHLRLARGWKQLDVERASGVDQTTISRLERGKQTGLSIHALAAILEALQTGRVRFLPPKGPQPTALELMLYGDRWKRAGEAADWHLARSKARSAARSATRGRR